MAVHPEIILSGERVALALMTEADQTMFCTWLQSPVLREQIDDPRIPTMEEQQRWFQRVQKADRKFFSLVTISDGTLIGNCGFVDIDPVKNEATLRITIGDPNAHGKGYGTEAVQLLLKYGFEVMKLKCVLLKVLKLNQRAVRTYEKAGFTVLSENIENDKAILTMSIKNPQAL